MSNSPRQFADFPAVREKVPLWVGLSGPSGGGKTYSAHRLAKGMQRVQGGDIYGIDTESKRMLHYADKFSFRHVPFNAPFGSLDYLEAARYCIGKGAGIIIIDSMSHEHEGEGGCLECHEAELQRLSGGDWKKAQAMNMLAWAKPKQARRRMINSLLQLNASFIFCFRAKDKIKIKKGEQPTQLGFMPIAGEELVFEMTANALLLPGAGGVPTWMSEEIGEKTMIKLPEQFRKHFLEQKIGQPLDEDAGEFMARWAMGDVKTDPGIYDAAIAKVKAALTITELDAAVAESRTIKGWPKDKGALMKATIEEQRSIINPIIREPGDD